MATSKKSNNRKTEVSKIELDPILNLSAAMGLHEDFSNALGKECPVDIDGSNVEQLTTPCLQIIVSAGASWKAAGHSFSFNNPSEAVSIAFKDLGLNSYLESWSTIS